MVAPDGKEVSKIVDIVKSWIPRRPTPANISRDFWMPDQSCRVCYECDSQFTIFNLRHHCRLCGKVFCIKCSSNSVPTRSHELKSDQEELDLIRACNYCFKQWKQESSNTDDMMTASSPRLCSSSSSSSLVSAQSRGYSDSSAGLTKYTMGPFQQVSCAVGQSPRKSERIDSKSGNQDLSAIPGTDQFGPCYRSDDDDDDNSHHEYGSYSGAATLNHDFYSGTNNSGEIDKNELHEVHTNEETGDSICNSGMFSGNLESRILDVVANLEERVGNNDVQSDRSPLDALNGLDVEPVDYENNGLLWIPPDPENDKDDSEVVLSDDDAGEDVGGELGYSRCGSFGGRDCRSRDRSNEEHRKTMKKAVDGHFRALITQLLQAENIPVSNHGTEESWLDIITRLSWEAATFLKPDTSVGGGMDPGGYCKVKCIACGHRNRSMVSKGVICKKNVAHRRMSSKIGKACLLLLGGALEYQRVSNHLSSFDTLLQQEMDHLKMAVAKIDAFHPNVLLVEKSVSRYAQEYLLAKGISLVLNIKRPLLERIARCSGAEIVPSIDHLSSPKLGYCDLFHVERFLEDLGSAGQEGKKLTKTLMFFEGCPRPLGCTILLKGASGNELKRVKHVVHYGVFAAYHLALETSFLADEGASVPELPLKSPIKVALPDEPSGFERPCVLSPQQEHVPLVNFCVEKPELGLNERSEVESGQGVDCSRVDGYKMPQNLDTSELMSLNHGVCHHRELASFKEEFPPSPSDHQSILVSLSTRCMWKGSICQRAHIFRIKYYGSCDKPLGRFLQDHLFDQDYLCRSCEMPSEAHIYCYTHQQGSLTISVKKLPGFFLPGEHVRKIWMWHRCLRCPRTFGFPPATKRVVMSDAAWGLSFGKFLELSFSNHAAASRVASCGHSLHRDCLRFYGSGRMVACFRYAPIIVHSVHLPPPNLEFNYKKQEWLQKELDEVSHLAGLFFTEVSTVLSKIFERITKNSCGKPPGSVQQIAELNLMLQEEKKDFEELLWSMFNKEVKSNQPEVDIIEINSIRRRLVFHSYIWDQRLIHFSRSDFQQHLTEKPATQEEKPPVEIDAPPRFWRGFRSCESFPENFKTDLVWDQVEDGKINLSSRSHNWMDVHTKESDYPSQCSGTSSSNESNGQEFGKIMRRARSVGHFTAMDTLSDNLNTAWTGIHPPEAIVFKENGVVYRDSSPGTVETAEDNCTDVKFRDEMTRLFCSVLSENGHCDMENPSCWVREPFSTLYKSLNKIFSANSQNPGKISGYNPVYISFFRLLVQWGGGRMLMPAASSDIVIPVYDDEPSSIISYALVSPEYRSLMSEETERVWKASVECTTSLPILDPINLLSHFFDETLSESLRSNGSSDESILSSGLRSSLSLEPLLVPNSLHASISFSDDGHPGKVRFNVTCYFAKQFEALRRSCCPSEIDFIRSLSRCKNWGAQGGKSNVFFAKTLDDRFIIKQVTKTELESFIKFAPSYFKYISESILTGCPTSLAKILGIYQVSSKPLKGGKESRIVVLVMENLLFNRNITQLYDLKGSARSRYNSDCGNNKVLLDQNLLDAMQTSPIFLATKAKHLLERAIWNDTSFLASIDVMDYSLLVGMDEEKHELVLGIIDFMRQYTWDKHLETWVKASGILGGPKNTAPTVISPQQYKKRFRKAMSAYFLMVPDQWSSYTVSVQGD